ncbi:YqcC family protein [Dickeya dadantii]|uniref:YqcC family protein n=1 Tax=Dickeya dadantii TaxID=204038 RepID=UPI0003A3254E|nr:YqcC family protein [Dickeya dadantii]NPE54927.1 YqcC family protein [Dickeya dadantii]NPE57842.1 YqcC family protein [Dickeya dadantii]NPE68130.1 YqcC family protein [Dickeya dadantii]NPE69985.1 YqcC family protein [Dickeya dadantii]
MSVEIRIRQSLFAIEHALKASPLWQPSAPDEAAFASQEPFCIDTMAAEQWLQWIFLPRMHALLDSGAPLPARLAILPYFEVAFDGRSDDVGELLAQLGALDALFEE